MKERVFTFKVSEEDYRRIVAEAEGNGLKPGTWVRGTVLLALPGPATAAIKRVASEVRKPTGKLSGRQVNKVVKDESVRPYDLADALLAKGPPPRKKGWCERCTRIGMACCEECLAMG